MPCVRPEPYGGSTRRGVISLLRGSGGLHPAAAIDAAYADRAWERIDSQCLRAPVYIHAMRWLSFVRGVDTVNFKYHNLHQYQAFD
jgi:hypothetical protein